MKNIYIEKPHKEDVIKTPNQLLHDWFTNTPKQERDVLLNEFDQKKYEGFPIFETGNNYKTASTNGDEQINYVRIEYKAYGAYSGSYDGGSVGNELYWSKDKAREECIKLVEEANKDNRHMLRFSLKSFPAKTEEHKEIRAEYQRRYAPMKEIHENVWKSECKDVRVVEFNIK